jgi:hypothetical protein
MFEPHNVTKQGLKVVIEGEAAPSVAAVEPAKQIALMSRFIRFFIVPPRGWNSEALPERLVPVASWLLLIPEGHIT